MSDFVENKSKAIEAAREKTIVTAKQYMKPKFISAVFELIIAVVVIMGVELLSFGFNIAALKGYYFWVKVGACTVGIFLLYRAVVNARFEKTANRESVVKVRDEYNKKNENKDLNMKDWLRDIYNPSLKVEAYVSKINHKIYKLDRRVMKTFNVKKRAKLEAKIEQYKYFISKEYIEKNIDRIHVKYYMVFYDDFHNESICGNNGETYTRGNYNQAFNKASFNKIWMYVLSSALLGVSVFSMDKLTVVSVVTSITSTALMVITRIVTALLEADQLYDKTITRSLYGRIDVLDEYEKYKKNNPVKTEIEKIKDVANADAEEKAEAKWKAFYQDKLKEDLVAYKEKLDMCVEKKEA